jgi:hypothetical protein
LMKSILILNQCRVILILSSATRVTPRVRGPKDETRTVMIVGDRAYEQRRYHPVPMLTQGPRGIFLEVNLGSNKRVDHVIRHCGSPSQRAGAGRHDGAFRFLDCLQG